MARGNKAEAEGRRGEFEAVALPHLASLHHFAMRLVRDPERAQDLVQDSILRAWRFFDRFEPGSNAKAWLFRILKNTLVNQYHYERRRPEQTTMSGLDWEIESADGNEGLQLTDENPESEFLRGVVQEEVETALREMPEDFRSVVNLNLVEGFSYQETADILSIPIGTVMSRLHRGRKILQRRLMPLAGERGFTAAGPAPN